MRSEVVISERQIVRNIPITQVTAISTANNTNVGQISVKSAVAADAMKITVWGVLSGSSTIVTEELTIAGTAAVTTTATTYSQFYGAFLGYKDGRLSSRSTGAITISNGAGSAIATITAGSTSTGMLYFYLAGQNIVLENIAGNTWFNTVSAPFVGQSSTTNNAYAASTTNASIQMTGRMNHALKVTDYLSIISDGTGSTVQVIVFS